ncbi:hypothetical protein FRC11_013298 [Ceratobasidium sp. 423]|nr:hypothetical protein FRC11_013298 [Ceratobasidium sp. 423]
MSVAYRGKTAGYKDSPELLSAIRLAMGYWLASDYSTIGDSSCMDRDYVDSNCPCGTPALWNENRYSNVIQIPSHVGPACNMLRSELTESELGNCTLITSRALAPFYREKYPNYLSGANAIDISVIGIDAGFWGQMQLEDVIELGNAWGQEDFIGFGAALTQAADSTSVNVAKITGNRMFWSPDYMVYRTEQTVTTVKMLSDRTSTSKRTNSEGPYSFHLSDGAVYTYSTGAEYEDMFAALDYNIILGITTDYNGTALECASVEQDGVDPYAGGVEADVGMAAMRYINPLPGAFSFYKAWFFFPDNVQHVLVTNIGQANSNPTSPVYSVLDQRLHSGDVYINGTPISESGNQTEAKSLWHAGTGYAFPTTGTQAVDITVSLETRAGDRSKLGTGKVVATPKDMFTAWILHETLTLNPSPDTTNSGPGKYTPIEYSVFPAIASNEEFEDKASRLRPRTVANTETVSAAIDSFAKVVGAAFWKAEGGSVTVKDMGIKVEVEVDRNVVLMIKFDDDSRTDGTASVVDPTQGTGKVTIKITPTGSKRRGHRGMGGGHLGDHHLPVMERAASCSATTSGAILTLDLPEGEVAGSTVVGEFLCSA